MKFEKGKSGNPKGRPKGAKNKTTDEVRALVKDIVLDNWPRLQTAIKKMSDEKLVMVLERLLKHVLPAPVDEIERLSNDDVKRVATEIMNRTKNETNG